MLDLEKRIDKLERRWRDVAIAAGAISLALVLFLGYTWQSIPRRVADALQDTAIKRAEEKAVASAEAADKEWRRAKSAASSAESALNRATAAANNVEKVESARISAIEDRLKKKILWGVNKDDSIYYSKDEGKHWNLVNGKLKQVSAGEGIVWGVNKYDYIFYSKDEGKSWQRVDGGLKHISVWP